MLLPFLLIRTLEESGWTRFPSLAKGLAEAARIAEIAARYGIEIALPARGGKSGHSSRPFRDIDS